MSAFGYEHIDGDLWRVTYREVGIGYVRNTGDEWMGYMGTDRKYPCGIGTREEAAHGVLRIHMEMVAEQAFERRYA